MIRLRVARLGWQYRAGDGVGRSRGHSIDMARRLFNEIERIVTDDKVSVAAAATRLAEEGKVAGAGTPTSSAKRLAARFRRERRDH